MSIRLVDDLDTHDKGAWLCSPQARLDECDLKLLAAFAPSSLQDMQVQHCTTHSHACSVS
jgi:hypothetical protein